MSDITEARLRESLKKIDWLYRSNRQLGEPWQKVAQRMRDEAVAALASPPPRTAELVEALRLIRDLQPKALDYIEANGFVMDVLGPLPDSASELDRWKVLAFSLYTDLCQANSEAERALAATASPTESTQVDESGSSEPSTAMDALSEQIARAVLNEAYEIADGLDSNHARFVIQKVADRRGVDLDYPPVNEQNNRLREQLAEAEARAASPKGEPASAQAVELAEALERVAPADPMSQDEMGGCVWCGGTPRDEPYGYATAHPSSHMPDCDWLNARRVLAAYAETDREPEHAG